MESVGGDTAPSQSTPRGPAGCYGMGRGGHLLLSSFGTGACPCRCPSGDLLSPPKPKHWDKKKKQNRFRVPVPAQLVLGQIRPRVPTRCQGAPRSCRSCGCSSGRRESQDSPKGSFAPQKKARCCLGQAEGTACGWVTRDSPRSIPAGRGGAGQGAEGDGWGRSATRCPQLERDRLHPPDTPPRVFTHLGGVSGAQPPSNAPRIPVGLPEHRGRSERAALSLLSPPQSTQEADDTDIEIFFITRSAKK